MKTTKKAGDSSVEEIQIPMHIMLAGAEGEFKVWEDVTADDLAALALKAEGMAKAWADGAEGATVVRKAMEKLGKQTIGQMAEAGVMEADAMHQILVMQRASMESKAEGVLED